VVAALELGADVVEVAGAGELAGEAVVVTVDVAEEPPQAATPQPRATSAKSAAHARSAEEPRGFRIIVKPFLLVVRRLMTKTHKTGKTRQGARAFTVS
jgi:hypothetical protein